MFISWGAVLTIFGMATGDGSFIELNIHLAGQFQIIQTELKNLVVHEIGTFDIQTCVFPKLYLCFVLY